ncbi:MAG: threonylcarbamoyl-AMP synthase [Ignavibacteriae bacterium]|nr:threonylcarbamoyl-AMP synthase [Ignavibacteriota bacterium]MCB9216039.1 threonylcarbamoyl-AMP synthase [Ignavibacteria bacterium]
MQTQLLETTSNFRGAIAQAAKLIEGGELVAFPTETVYGLGADVTRSDVVEKVFRAKGRPIDNPMIVHVADIEGMRAAAVVDWRTERIVGAFTPGPLTLVLPALSTIPAIARAGLPTVAVRIPDHPVALALLQETGPLVAPSANLSGRPSPTTAQHVLDDLSGRIAAVLDGGPCRVGIESTVLDLTTDNPIILRPGVIELEEIREFLLRESASVADVDSDYPSTEIDALNSTSPRAPGMKYRHYAPQLPVHLVLSGDLPSIGTDTLVLTTNKHIEKFEGKRVEIVSESSLYEQFRRAESEGLREILIYADLGELPSGLLNRMEKAVAGE